MTHTSTPTKQKFNWTAPYLGPLQAIEPLPIEASTRRFIRLIGSQETAVLMTCPNDYNALQSFHTINLALQQANLPVAKIFTLHAASNSLLMQDLGDQWLGAALNPKQVVSYYKQAIDLLVQSYQSPIIKAHAWPAYSDAMLHNESFLLPTWYAHNHCHKPLTSAELQTFTHCVSLLVNTAQSQPKVWVHRDFHARNLMLLPSSQIMLIDYQDAVIGPLMYDIVSLLKDCYYLWPTAVSKQCLHYFCQQMIHCDILPGDHPIYQRWFDWMGLQRHLKVLGIFSRLAYRDHKPHYLKYLPRVWHYALTVCTQYPELHPLVSLLNNRPPS
jgi:N-acetylmuramate 1-kinase